MRHSSSQSGFTLLELVAVLTVLGILTTVAVQKYFDLTDEAQTKAVIVSAAEVQARSEAVFGQKLLAGLSCTEARTFAADLVALSDTPAAETARFGDFEMRRPAVVAPRLPLDYRLAGSDSAWQTVPNFYFALPACGDEDPTSLSNDTGAALFQTFLKLTALPPKSDVKNSNGYQFSIFKRKFERSEYLWFNSNVQDWNHKGTPIVSFRRKIGSNAMNAYVCFVPNDQGPYADDLLLPSPQNSYKDVTQAKRGEYLEIFKQNFPDYQKTFDIQTSSDGYQYLVLKSSQ